MKLTAEKFFKLLKDKGITCSAPGNILLLNGTDTELIHKLYELIDKSPDFEAGIVHLIHQESGMNLNTFQFGLKKYGIKVELKGLSNLIFTGGKNNAREHFSNILEANSYLKAAVILSLAVKDSDLLDMIQERACIRWAEGYSDSLHMAVLSGIALTGETSKRDSDGQIILKPKTDWNV